MYYTIDHDGYPALSIPLPCFGKGGFRLHEDKASSQIFHDLSDELQQIVDRYAEKHGWYRTVDGARHWNVPAKPITTYPPSTILPIEWKGPAHRERDAIEERFRKAWAASAPAPQKELDSCQPQSKPSN